MNKTYNYEIRNSPRCSYGYSASCGLSATERFLEILSYIINAIFYFVTNDAVVLISKLSIVVTSLAGIFVMMGMSVCGIMSFFPAFIIALGLLAVILLTFKSMLVR